MFLYLGFKELDSGSLVSKEVSMQVFGPDFFFYEAINQNNEQDLRLCCAFFQFGWLAFMIFGFFSSNPNFTSIIIEYQCFDVSTTVL